VRPRSTIGRILVAALAGGAAGVVVGTVITSYRVELLRAEVSQLEQSRVRLQGNADAMAAALREARSPLERRIQELETLLAVRETAPRPEKQEEDLAVVAATESVPSDAPTEEDAAVSPPRVEEPVTPESTASAEPPTMKETAASQRVEEPEAEEVATSSPPGDAVPAPAAVSAPPPVTESPCSALALPDFALDSPGAEVQFFDGRMVLGIDASGPDLVMRLGDDARHPLAELPLHVATQCEDFPYIVSICVAERDPFEVRGVVSPADAWHKPCRALLQRRENVLP
jgi:hypothetical protein